MAGYRQPPKGKPFEKGDPRINRKGRPKDFAGLRSLSQQIAHEVAKSNGVEIEIDGRKVTVVEAVIRGLATSKNLRYQLAFLELAYGKVPDAFELSGPDGGTIVVRWLDVEGKNPD